MPPKIKIIDVGAMALGEDLEAYVDWLRVRLPGGSV